MPEPKKAREHDMTPTISILRWVPDLDEVQRTLEGTVPPSDDDVVKRGDKNDRSQNR